LVGPLGSTPRLFTVSYATLEPHLFGMGLPLFSVLAALLLVPFVLTRSQVMRILGYILTPMLLLSLAVIIIRGIANPPAFLPETNSPGTFMFEGLQDG